MCSLFSAACSCWVQACSYCIWLKQTRTLHHHSAWLRLFTSLTAAFFPIMSSELNCFSLRPLSLSCSWRLESWPIVLRTISIARWHLIVNNESTRGLHLSPRLLLSLSFTSSSSGLILVQCILSNWPIFTAMYSNIISAMKYGGIMSAWKRKVNGMWLQQTWLLDGHCADVTHSYMKVVV